MTKSFINSSTMKKFVLIKLILLVSLYGYGQTKYPLVLTSFQVKLNGELVNQNFKVEEELQEDVEKEIEIFNDKGVRFVVSFKFVRSGKRIKLVRRSYAQKDGEKPRYGKKRKDVHFIKVSIPGKIEGQYNENILLDSENLESMFVSYQYNLIYKF